MASVLYVTDRNMIEFHRLNGADELNFWRPMSQTKMKKFYPGDYIFFFTKTDISGRQKGVVGYGEYVRSEKLSLKSMWRKYKEKNGYASYEQFEKAIKEYAHEIPDKLSCLFIKHVVFFQQPIFPSQINMQVPNKLESFTYLYDGENDYTYQILSEASKVGISMWTSMVTESAAQSDWLERDLRKNRISVLQDEIQINDFSKTVLRENKKMMELFSSNHPEIKKINDRGEIYYIDKENKINIYMACSLGSRDIEKIRAYVGYLSMWAKHANDEKAAYEINVLLKDNTKKLIEEKFELSNQIHLISFP